MRLALRGSRPWGCTNALGGKSGRGGRGGERVGEEGRGSTGSSKVWSEPMFPGVFSAPEWRRDCLRRETGWPGDVLEAPGAGSD